MEKIAMHKKICKTLTDLYERKNADYGDSFGKSFKEYGLTMACIRLEDKLNRIKSLNKQEAKVNDERIEDTLMDLANYAIMTLVEMGEHESDELPTRGSHGNECEHTPDCLCLSCCRDNWPLIDDDACCIKHHRRCGHGDMPCPDYVREE